MATVQKINQREARGAIERREDFEASALSGRRLDGVSATWASMGRLSAEWRAAWREAADSGQSMYAVWSYGTPIAWAYGDTIVRPPVKYSVTTSRHQSITAWLG